MSGVAGRGFRDVTRMAIGGLLATTLALAGCAAPGGPASGGGFGTLEGPARGVDRDARDLQRASWERSGNYNNDQSR